MAGVQLLAGERYEGESSRAVQACNDYLRLGPARSLRKLAQKYGKTRQNTAPTDSLNTLEMWSADFDWQRRAADYDAEIEREKNERRRKELDAGLALDFERVRKLKRLSRFLEAQIFEEIETVAAEGEELPEGSPYSTVMRSSAHRYGNVWLPDVKQIGGGDAATRVDIVRFNSAIIEQYRGTLDDLAKETGGRKQKQEHSGTIATVGMTIDQWRAEQRKNRDSVAQTLTDFDDDE